MQIFGFDIRRSARRFLSSEFEDAVNKALTADMVADKTSRPVITPEGSLALTAVWACVRILSETVGTLPIHLYRRMPKGRERQYAHPSAHILQRPNSYSTCFDLMHFLMISCTLWGNGYARIYRDRLYRPVQLKYYHPAKVTPVLTDNEKLFYRLDNGEMLTASDMIHLKGLSTDGIVAKVRLPSIATISPFRSRRRLMAKCSSIREVICQGYSNTPRHSNRKHTSD